MKYCTFGSKERSIRELVGRLETLLDVKFELHDSDHFNGEYFKSKTSKGEILYLTDNEALDEDGEVLEPELSQYKSIFEVHEVSQEGQIIDQLKMLSDIEIIKCEVVD